MCEVLQTRKDRRSSKVRDLEKLTAAEVRVGDRIGQAVASAPDGIAVREVVDVARGERGELLEFFTMKPGGGGRRCRVSPMSCGKYYLLRRATPEAPQGELPLDKDGQILAALRRLEAKVDRLFARG